MAVTNLEKVVSGVVLGLAATASASAAPSTSTDGFNTQRYPRVRTLLDYTGTVDSANVRVWFRDRGTGEWYQGADTDGFDELAPGGGSPVNESRDWEVGRWQEVYFQLAAIAGGGTAAIRLQPVDTGGALMNEWGERLREAFVLGAVVTPLGLEQGRRAAATATTAAGRRRAPPPTRAGGPPEPPPTIGVTVRGAGNIPEEVDGWRVTVGPGHVEMRRIRDGRYLKITAEPWMAADTMVYRGLETAAGNDVSLAVKESDRMISTERWRIYREMAEALISRDRHAEVTKDG